MDEGNWCIQWSGEVLPEAAMIPDLGVFLRSASAYSQAVTDRKQGHASPVRSDEVREALFAQARERFPARLKLPFILSPTGENKALTVDQQSAPMGASSDGR